MRATNDAPTLPEEQPMREDRVVGATVIFDRSASGGTPYVSTLPVRRFP